MSNPSTNPQYSSSAGDAPHIGTHIPSSGIGSEKHDAIDEKNPEGTPLDDEEDEDIDQLIDDLESQDGHEEIEDDSDAVPGSSARPVPEDLLQTDTRTGLTSAEVDQRRKKYGLNQMKEEKENLILKFLMYFVGPIQFVMEVSIFLIFSRLGDYFYALIFFFSRLLTSLLHRLLLFLLPVLRIGSILELSVLFFCLTLVLVSFRNSRLVLSSRS